VDRLNASWSFTSPTCCGRADSLGSTERTLCRGSIRSPRITELLFEDELAVRLADYDNSFTGNI